MRVHLGGGLSQITTCYRTRPSAGARGSTNATIIRHLVAPMTSHLETEQSLDCVPVPEVLVDFPHQPFHILGCEVLGANVCGVVIAMYLAKFDLFSLCQLLYPQLSDFNVSESTVALP